MQRFRAATAIVALVSRNRTLVDQIVSLLTDETTRVEVHECFERLLESIPLIGPDVVIIDDRVEHDAPQKIRLLRRRQPLLHIVYVNVRDEGRSIVLLHGGADDSIGATSPTFVARLQAATRRARTMNAGSRIAIGDVVFDREARRVWCAGDEVLLTPHEFGVVDCLFWHTPKAVSVDTLSDFVWGDETNGSRRTLVQVYVSYVRKKLKASTQVAIKFARGAGYEFSPRGSVEGKPSNGKH
jgi:DNA-binding response OmpR family regulator